MPMPTFVAAGAATRGTGTITPTLPAGIVTNDILFLFIETGGGTAGANPSITNSNGGTWTQVTNSPQSIGTTPDTDPYAKLAVFWSRYNGTQGAPTVSDSGNHQTARILGFNGALLSGTPYDITVGSTEATSDTSGSITGGTTTVDNCLIIAAIAGSGDPGANGTTSHSSWANADLANVTELSDMGSTTGNGSTLGIASGEKATAGAFGATTVTLGTAGYKAMLVIALKEEPPPPNPVTVLNTTDNTETTDTSPTLEFTGTDPNGDSILYELEIDSASLDTVVDSFSNATIDNGGFLYSSFPAEGQSFTPNATGNINRASFWLKRSGSPTGTGVVKIYAHSGTYGTSSVGTGTALATSDPVNLAAISTSVYEKVTFQFSAGEQISLTSGTRYVAVVEYTGGDASNYFLMGFDGSSPTHGGNRVYKNGSSWTAWSAGDCSFEIIFQAKQYVTYASDIDNGFVNTVTGGDTSPFNSGEKVSFTFQSEALLQRQDSTGTNFGFGQFTGVRYRGQVLPVFGRDGTITKIGFDRAKGSMGVKVYFDTVTSNAPTNAVGSELYSFTIPNASLVNGYGEYSLPAALNITKGVQYCFYIAPWNTSTDLYQDDYQDVHGIGSGTELTNNNGTWSTENLCWSYRIYGDGLLTPGLYNWRARGKDPAGSNTFGAWSAYRKFAIFKTDREVSVQIRSTIPSTNDGHNLSSVDTYVAENDAYDALDDPNDTYVTKTGDKPYFYQKVQFASDLNFNVNVEAQTNADGQAGGSTSQVASVNTTLSGSWTNPDNAWGAADAVYATTVGTTDEKYKITTGFSIPTDATITAVRVSTVGHANVANSSTIGWTLAVGGSSAGVQNTTHNLGADTTSTTSGSAMWSAGFLTVANLNAGSLEVWGSAGSGTNTLSIDRIYVTVFYTVPTRSVKIDVWNDNTSSWENLVTKQDHVADTNFTVSPSKTTSLTDYYDASHWVTARLYLDHSGPLDVDVFTITQSSSTTVTKTHTTDSLIKKIDNTKTHTTNTLIKKLDNTKTHTTDALLKKTSTVSHSTDVLLKKALTVSHSTDSDLKGTVTKTHTTDSLIKKLDTTKSHTTDVLTEIEVAKTHTTDTLTKATLTQSHSADIYKLQAAELLKDNFNDNTLDTVTIWNKWGGGNIVNTNGRLELTSGTTGNYYGMQTWDSFSFRDTYQSMEVVDVGNQSIVSWSIQPVSVFVDSSNKYYVNINQGNLEARHVVAGSDNAFASIAYNATNHRWLRIREGSGTVYFEYSADGISWTSWASETAAMNLNSVLLEVLIGTWQAEALTTTAILDNLSIFPTTKSHTTDIFVSSPGVEISHTTDTLLEKVSTVSHTTDIRLKKALTVSHTTDALLKKALIVSHSTDSDLKGTVTKLHNTDILIKKELTRTHTTDALLKKALTISHSTDILLKKTFTVTHTTDVLLKKALTVSHSTDTDLDGVVTKSHTADILLKKALVVVHTTDVLLKKTNTKVHTTDILIKKGQTVSHSTDILIKKALTVSHTTDVLLKKAQVTTHTTDTDLKSSVLKSHSTDVLVKKGITTNHTTDTLLKRTQTVSHTTSILINGAGVKFHLTDVYLKKTQTRVHTTDVDAKGLGLTKSHITDVLIKKANNIALHTTDADLKGTVIKSHSTDVFIKKSFTRSHTTDVLKQKIDNVTSHSTDTLLEAVVTKTHTTDTDLKKLDITRTHTTDISVVQSRTKSHITDTMLYGVRILSHTTDIYKIFVITLSHTTDVLIARRIGNSKKIHLRQTQESITMLKEGNKIKLDSKSDRIILKKKDVKIKLWHK